MMIIEQTAIHAATWVSAYIWLFILMIDEVCIIMLDL